jgi:hypothetical protein
MQVLLISVPSRMGREKMPKQNYPPVSEIMAYESGELSQEQELELFQKLVDSGLAWKLQGSYGRRAAELLRSGQIQVKP